MKYVITLLVLFAVSFTAQAEAKEINLTSDNTIILDKEVSSESVNEVMEQAKKLDAKLASGYPIYLFLYTPGGSIQAGAELIEYLEGLNRPVHTITLFAASMGFQIAQHMGTRYVMKYGVLMSHKARGSFSGSFGGGIGQMDTRYSLWLRRIALMDKKTVERTNGKQTMESYINSYSPELWLNGAEAVEQGYADEVVQVKCDDSIQGTRDEVLDFGMFKVTLTFSNCPLQTGPISVKIDMVTNKGWMSLDKFLASNGTFQCEKEQKVVAKKADSNSRILPPYYQDEVTYEDDAVQQEKVEEKLCAKDPNMTLETLKNKQKEALMKAKLNPQDNVVYSY